MIKQPRNTIQYQKLSSPIALAICILLALFWLLTLSAGETVLAAPDGNGNSVDAAPVAADDAYTTTGYAPLNIPAPGVLGNDSDPDGDPLMAILESTPGFGSLNLNSDGSFTYQAVPGFVGTDSFTYIAADGDAPAQAYWPFEEGSGATTADATGNGYYGTLMNGPSFTTTVPVTPTFNNNYAIDFDGVDDYIQAPAINLANRSFSIAFWAQRDRTGVSDFILGQGTSSENYGLHIGFRNNNLFTCAFWNNDLDTPSAYTDSNWHHWACTYDAANNERTIYVDGTAVVSDTASTDYLGSGPFYIGSYFNGGGPFDGLLDDVRVYLTPLTAAQVQATMTSNQLALGDRAIVNVTVPTGVLAGEVTDSSNGTPIADASVAAAYNPSTVFTTQSDEAGMYDMVVPAETFTVTAQAFGYAAVQFTGVSVPTGITTPLDISMDRLNKYVVDGVVTDAYTGWPLYASIDIDGYPGDPIWTNPETGYYSISLPEGITYTFNVEAFVPGYEPASRGVGPLTGNATEVFGLDVDQMVCIAPGYQQTVVGGIDQDFETWPPAGWQFVDNISGGTGLDWQIDTFYGDSNYTNGGGHAADVNSDANSGVRYDAEMRSPVFDLSAIAVQTLDYRLNYQDISTSTSGDFFDVDISTDGGATWTNLRHFTTDQGELYAGPGVADSINLAAYGVATAVQIRWHYYTGSTSPWDWYAQVDQVRLGGSPVITCTPTPGGLVVGNVYDENTSEALNGSTVENEAGFSAQAVATPLDDALDDGFYSIFSPSGSQTFTTTMSGKGYGVDIDTFSVVMSNTVRHDFNLPAGWLEATPTGLAVTLDVGDSATLPLTLSNAGTVDANFEFLELNGGYTPVLLNNVPSGSGSIEWLYRHSQGMAVQADQTDNGSTLAYPGAYRYLPTYPTSDANILVYTDDWVHTTPNTLVQQALSILGLPATVYVNGDYTGFESALTTGGPWDLVVWSGENSTVPSSTLTALLDYLQGGGKLAATYWRQQDIPNDPLWVEMGFTYISNYVTPPPTYWWQASHPLFNSPESVPEWLNRVQNSGNSQGTRLEPLGNGQALAGYTTSPTANEAGIILRDDGMALYKGLRDVSTNADDDSDGVLDGTELWVNIFTLMLYDTDVPWLSEDPITGTVTALDQTIVDVTFDASAVLQPGDYYATLIATEDTPYSVAGVLVTMTVNTPPAWGKVGGTLTLLGYCDADPTTPKNREILIEGSSGFTATTNTDANGYYQWWIDPSENPLTITVTPIADYQEGTASGVMIVTGQTTTVDFNLRLLKPCVSTEPTYFEKVLFLGDTLTDTLDLYNGGAISTTFDITETGTIPWLSEAPLTGTLDADSLDSIDITFDSSGMASTGMYNGELRVDTDDPVHGTILIPVDMAVVSGTTGISLSPDSTQIGGPGVQVIHTFTVTNSGNVTNIYDLSLSGNLWGTSEPPDNTSFLQPGENFTFSIAVQIPNNPALQSAIIGSDSFAIMAISQLDGSNATATGTTLAEVAAGVMLSTDQSASGLVGTTIDYTLQVTNTGGYTDTFNLALSGNIWTTALSANSITLGAGASGDLVVSVSIPAGATEGDFDLATVTATSTNDPSSSDQAIFTTTAFKYWIYLPLISKSQ